MYTRIFSYLCVISIVVLGGANYGHASGVGVRMDPILVERSVMPGSTMTYTLYVQNQNRFSPLVGNLAVVDITEDIRGTYQLAPADSTSYSLARWVTIEPSMITVPAGGIGEVQVMVSVPRGVFGGRYGAIALTLVDTTTPETPGASRVNFQLASFIEMTIQGGAVRREAYVTAFRAVRSGEIPELRSRVGDTGLVFSTEIFNSGNIHIAAQGSLIIHTSDGRTVARYPLGGGRGVILPEATVELRSVIGSNLPPGDYSARAVINYGASRPLVSELQFSITADELQSQSQAKEAEIGRFSVSPQEIEVTLVPGAFRSVVFELTNPGDAPVTISGSILPLAFDRFGEFLPEEERGVAPDWMDIMPSTVTIPPGRTVRVRLSMRPPRDAVGGHYADIIFRTVGDGVASQSGLSLLAHVGDDITRQGYVQIHSVVPTGDSLSVEAAFVNEGTTHVGLGVEVLLDQLHPEREEEGGRIIQARRETLATAVLPVSDNPVLPGSTRVFRFMIPANLGEGQYEFSVRVDYGGDAPAVQRSGFEVKGGETND